MKAIQSKKEIKNAKKPILNQKEFYYDVSEDDGAGYDGLLRICSVQDGSCLKIDIAKLLIDIKNQQEQVMQLI